MKLLAKYNNEALFLCEDDVMPKFKVMRNITTLTDNSLYIGLPIFESYDISKAVLALYNINYNINTVITVMDSVNIEDFGIFECNECGRTLPIEERCIEHYDKSDCVCKDCCADCQEEFALGEQINIETDRLLLDEDI